jgi:hypothetical protein
MLYEGSGIIVSRTGVGAFVFLPRLNCTPQVPIHLVLVNQYNFCGVDINISRYCTDTYQCSRQDGPMAVYIPLQKTGFGFKLFIAFLENMR